MSAESFGHTLALIRKNAGINQGALAETLGITQPYLSQIECGHKEASIALLEKISKELGVPAGYIHLVSVTRDQVSEERIAPWEMLNPIIVRLAVSIFPKELNGL